MRITLYKYIFYEIVPTFLTSLLVFSLIMVGTRMLSITDWIVNRGVSPFKVIRLTLYILPNILLFALPAVTLMSVLVAFLRLSSDNEMISLKSLGISLYQLLPPVLTLSFVSFILAGLMAVFGVSWGNRSFKDTIYQIVESSADIGVKEGVFCEPFNDILFYIHSISPRERIMKDVFVMDKRNMIETNTIVAKQGKILSHPESKTIIVRFLNGTIFNLERDTLNVRTVRFLTYDLNINLADIMSGLALREKAPREMSIQELIGKMGAMPKEDSGYNELAIELLERFSMPFAVFFMGIIGVPLGIQARTGGRSFGIMMSLGIFLLYYMCLMGAKSLGESGRISPFIGVWIPDLFLFFCSIYLVYTVAKERSFKLLERISFK